VITLTDRAASALSQSLSEEDRINGKVFRFKLRDGSTVEVHKEEPAVEDETLEHNGYPVLAVPSDVTAVFDNLTVDIAPTPEGDMALVIKSGKES
jgi:hypothetical protein